MVTRASTATRLQNGGNLKVKPGKRKVETRGSLYKLLLPPEEKQKKVVLLDQSQIERKLDANISN